LAVLQGMRKLRDLANASVLGSFLGLAVTLPLYYFYGIDGIVPAIILTSIASLLISWYFGRKVKTETIKVTRKIMFAEGKSMLIIGSVISVNGILALVTSYVMRIYINSRGGIADVGLYNAGFAIVNSYVGMIFTAMLTDYYPKLSSVVNDTKLFNQTINQQADIALLLIAPIISIFLVFIQIGVTVLLSTKFLAVEGMLIWAMLGVFFKTASWPIGFIFIPKGDSKLFFFSELAGNIYTFIFNIAGYYYWGLEGLGISFLIGYLIYYLQVSTIARLKYHFSFEPAFYRIFIVQFSLAVICFIIEKYLSIPYLKYPIGLLLIGISIWHSIKELNKRLNIKTLMASVKMKYGISFNSNDKRSDKTD
jgi:O-antigen/teichoic acid export membrane protein